MNPWLSADMVQLRRKRGSPQRAAQQHLACLQLVFAPFARGDFGDDLLRQHVERALGCE
jgi:hypothetical protein